MRLVNTFDSILNGTTKILDRLYIRTEHFSKALSHTCCLVFILLKLLFLKNINAHKNEGEKKSPFMHSAFVQLPSAIWEVKEQSWAVPATSTCKTAQTFWTISASSGHSLKSQFMTKIFCLVGINLWTQPRCDSNCDWLRADKKTQSANLKEKAQTGKAVSDKGAKNSTWCFLMQGRKIEKKEFLVFAL